MRQTIIAGNWKMNKTRKEARELTQAIVRGIEGKKDLPGVVLCPPFTALDVVIAEVAKAPVGVGAQNMDYRDSGAFTGEISPLMIVDQGAKYVIIGHSERRQLFGETNQSVNLKVKAALQHGLIPIVCVGETLDERESNLTDNVVSRQTAAALAELSLAELKPVVIAYEPVWAIGTGKVCEAEEANRVIGIIRKTVSNLHADSDLGQKVPVLYGGSVNPKNIAEQMAQPEIDGSLVGGASLKADEFLAIIEAAQKRVALSTTKA